MITLYGKTYTVARDETGPVVLIQHPNRGRAVIWRVASVRDSLRVFAGLKLCPLRSVE